MMRVTAEIRGFDVAGDIRFHGSHSEDEEVVNKLKELNDFLFDIFEQLEVVENQVKGRKEMSAVRIEREIKMTKESLLETFFIEDINQLVRKAESFDEIKDYLSRPSPIDEDRDEVQKIIDEYDKEVK